MGYLGMSCARRLRNPPARFTEYFGLLWMSFAVSALNARKSVEGEAGCGGDVSEVLRVESEKRCGFEGERDKERRSWRNAANWSTGDPRECACVGERR